MEDESGVNENECKLKPKQKSKLWKYFEIASVRDRTATCNVCFKLLSYRSSLSNLSKHFQRKHFNMIPKPTASDDEEGSVEELETYLEDEVEETEEVVTEEEPIDKRKLLRNGAWEYFEIHDEVEKIAICTLCKEQFSYRTTSTNLAKHLKRKHYSEIEDNEFLNTYEDDDEKSSDKKSYPGRTSAAWEYFTIKDPVRRVASCKLCDSTCSYWSSVSNLMKHVQRKHSVSRDYEYDSETAQQDGRVRRSPIWLYFKSIDNVAKISICLICKQQLSYMTSLSNLRRHLYRKHPGVKLGDGIDGKKMLIASDGTLYEIDDTTKTEALDADVGDDDQTEPLELNAIYLDDFEGSVIEPKRKRKSSKRKRLPSETIDCSESDEEITFQKRYVKKKTDSLDQFGKYLVSLLKQLPKELSNQLQADFVKQVMTAQLSYESQKVVVSPNNGFSITITERPEERNDVFASADGNNSSTEAKNSQDLWTYFETETASTSICCVCCASVCSEPELLRRHLAQEHPKLVGDLLTQDSEQTDEVFSEVIYLEENPKTKEQQIKVKKIDLHGYKKAKRRRYSQDITKRSLEEEEVEKFGSYVTCLMKQLPRDVCMSVQREIIDVIMNAKMKEQRKLDSEQTLIKDIMKEMKCEDDKDTTTEEDLTVEKENDSAEVLNVSVEIPAAEDASGDKTVEE